MNTPEIRRPDGGKTNPTWVCECLLCGEHFIRTERSLYFTKNRGCSDCLIRTIPRRPRAVICTVCNQFPPAVGGRCERCVRNYRKNGRCADCKAPISDVPIFDLATTKNGKCKCPASRMLLAVIWWTPDALLGSQLRPSFDPM